LNLSPRDIAARNGKRKYEGKPCKACGATERYTINCACVACTLSANKKETDRIKELLQASRVGA
jgi:hypothetical protein